MKIIVKPSILAALALLFFLPGMARAAVNCPNGTTLSVSVNGPYYVDPGETVTYSCVLLSGNPGGTYEWSIGDFSGPTTGSSVTLTAPMDASTSPGDQTISCTYTPPEGGCVDMDTLAATVLHRGSLVACYPFTGNAKDESGNGYDGTVVGAVLTADRFGQTGHAYYFDGINDRIRLPSDVMNFERTDSFSQSLWIKSNDTDGGNNILTKMNPTSTDSRGIGIVLVNGNLRVHLISSNGNVVRLIGSTGFTPLNDDVWHHVVVTYNGSSTAAGVTVYVDGMQQPMNVVNNSLSGTILNSSAASIGSRNTELYYKGAIDEVLIFNRVLDASDVMDLYSNEIDTDWDGDGLTYQQEVDLGTDPFDADSDGDGMSDGWEVLNGFAPLNATDGAADADGDELTNAQEFERGTDPNISNLKGVLVVMPDADQYQANEPDLSWTDLPDLP